MTDKLRKIVLFSLCGAFVLVIGVVAVMHWSGSDEEKNNDTVAVRAGDPILRTWTTTDDADNTEPAKLTFSKKMTVSGTVSHYRFDGTFTKQSDGTYTVYNKKGKKTYICTIDEDDSSLMSMDPAAAAASLHWTLRAD
ncbi:MAG: hypothetical protein ACOX41_04645 [Anaerovoracaceae bacterium]|jgi:hypothetical protein